MFGTIWCVMIAFSVILSFFTGRGAQVADAAMQGALEAVKMSIEMLGMIAFWNGIMNIAMQCGLVEKLAVIFRPVYRKLFKNIDENSEAGKNILLNLTANVLGLGNAATPFGLKAMREIGKTAGGTASDDAVLFIVMNTASMQLLPTTLIALRSAAKSAAPSEIIVPVWIVSVLALAIGIFFAKFMKKGGQPDT